jgi:competence protein ComEC
MEKYRIFSILSLSFILGVALSSFYYPKIISESLVYLTFVGTFIAVATFWKNKKVILISMAFLTFIFGIWLTSSRLENIENISEKKREFSGEVLISKEPQIKEKIQKLIFSSGENKRERFLFNASIYEEYNYGDKLKISCNLERIENFDDSFDYQMYLAKDRIFYQCKQAKIEKLNKNEGNKFLVGLIKIKNKLNQNLYQLIPAPESGLLSGLILGGSDLLSKEIQNNFSRTGMTHIVAVSGYNVTIIAQYLLLFGIFLGLWRRQAFWFALAGIFVFVILTGLSASAVRAGVMGVLLLWAIKKGRLANASNAILFSGCAMLLVNPLLLRWDIGFQLSFLATIGIVYLYPIFENYLMEKNKVFGIGEILFLTISAQLFVLPIIIFNFKTLSLISLLANILILPIIPFTMLVGFVTIVTSFIWKSLAVVFSWLVFLPLKYETLVINYLASFKYASIEMTISWQMVVVWYIILIGVVSFFKKKNKNE